MILNYITWNVDPVLFSIGSLSVRWYGLLWALGFLFGYLIMRRIYRREKMSEDSLDKLLIYMLLFTVIGARLGHCLFYEPDYYLSHPLKMLAVWEGGLASHGGAIGILLGLWFYVQEGEDRPAAYQLHLDSRPYCHPRLFGWGIDSCGQCDQPRDLRYAYIAALGLCLHAW